MHGENKIPGQINKLRDFYRIKLITQESFTVLLDDDRSIVTTETECI